MILLLGALMLAMGKEGITQSEDALRRPPQVLPAATNRLPKPHLLGSPSVRTLLGYTRRVLHLPDKRTLAVFSFSSAAQANWMFLIDSRTLSARRIPIPNNDFASHGAALGADGDIYILPYGNGRAYRYSTTEDRFEPINTNLPEGEYTWEAFGASNGRLYFGTYPNAYLGEYDPRTKQWALWKQVAPNAKYVTNFGEEQDGRIRLKAWGPAETWLLFDPKTRKVTEDAAPTADVPSARALPAPPAGDTAFVGQVSVAGRRFAISFPSGRLWEVGADGNAQLRGDPKSPAEPWYLETTEDSVIGISHFGVVFRYDLKTGRFQRKQVPNRAPGGNAIMFLETVTPRCVIGANYSQQNLFRIDPETGRITNAEQMIARVTGEAMCALGLGGRAYLGLYVHALLSVYDPKQPFAAGKNPSERLELHTRYQQTRPREMATDGQKVYMVSESDYNYLGGALTVFDPKTDQSEVYHQLLPDQNLSSLAYDPKTRLLWGGTDRWGQMRSHPPTQASSLLYAFDPITRRVVATLTPWPGADVMTVLGVSNNGVLVASNGQEIALIDTARKEILCRTTLSIGMPGRVKRGAGGQSYTLIGGALYRWDFVRNTLTPLAQTPGCAHLTEASPGVWLLANTASIYRFEEKRTGHENN